MLYIPMNSLSFWAFFHERIMDFQKYLQMGQARPILIPILSLTMAY